MSVVSVMAGRVLTGIILVGTVFASHKRVNATGIPSTFNVQAQSACEAEMLGRMDAREVFSGKAYDVLKKVARAYGRPVPHIYILPGQWNMAYIGGSYAVDGRGKIVVEQQAVEVFNNIALRGFLGHEMAHLVSDSESEGCNDYVIRDPQIEADADALAARKLGKRPVKAFLERVVALTESQNWDAKHRLEELQRFQLTSVLESR